MNKEITKPYLWKDRKDNFHNPKDMATRHIFYTLRMLWNHHAPERARLHPFIGYTFTGFYTTEYVKQSVEVLMKELSTRPNITPDMNGTLQHMRDWTTRLNDGTTELESGSE